MSARGAGSGAGSGASADIGSSRPDDTCGYIGLDISEALLRSGFNRLAKDVVRERRPLLAVITGKRLKALRRARADWIVCTSVLMHVPPSRLALFLNRICILAGPGTRIVITFDRADETHQTGPLTWAHSDALIVRELRRRLPGRAIAVRELELVDPLDGRSWTRARIFVGPASKSDAIATR